MPAGPSLVATTLIPNSASISGIVWHDLCISGAPGQPGPTTAPEGCVSDTQGGYKANGTRETGEPGIAAVPVSLFGPECDINNIPDNAAVTLTDYNGRFSFENLPAGTYCLAPSTAELDPGGWTNPIIENATGLFVIRLRDGQKENVDFGWDHQFLPMPDPVQSSPAPQATVDSVTTQNVEAAMSEYVAAQPGLSSAFKVSVEAVEGDYARVTVHSSDPQGGFGGYLKREGNMWTVLLIGSGINPYDLYVLGVPFSLLPEGARADELATMARVTVGYVAVKLNVRADKILVESPIVNSGYARVNILSPTGDGQMGGFSGYLKREEGNWVMLTIGSGFNPEELKQLGIPAGLLP